MIVTVAPVAMYPVDQVAGWSHSIWTVRETSQQDGFWGYAGLPRAELLARILAAGGLITVDHALQGLTRATGEILLTDGCHRWAIADELDLAIVPVIMETEHL